ncbi:response regulator [Sphingobium aromaticiconvertens]|uniref:response regulator n=1 Tax=Sphingobium aromaticiconvertens TaxID=365341 RepID=UPI0030160F7E
MRRGNLILVVDDNPVLRRLIVESLTVANYETVEACSADEALEFLRGSEKFGMVITDIEMPGSMDGVALANIVHERWPEIALIVTSGRVQPAAGALPRRAEFVKKPSRAHDFMRIVQSLIAAPDQGGGCRHVVLRAQSFHPATFPCTNG